MRSAFAAMLLLITFCSKPKDPHADHAAMVVGQLSGASLYQFHGKFTDQNGKALMLHELSGKYVFVAMFYATCTAICPRIAAEMLRLERSLSATQRSRSRFLLISLDDERDTPAALSKFIEKMRLTESFTLLRGGPDSVREVAAALGINYKRLENGEYTHSSLFSLLAPTGEILLQQAGLSVSVDSFRAKMEP